MKIYRRSARTVRYFFARETVRWVVTSHVPSDVDTLYRKNDDLLSVGNALHKMDEREQVEVRRGKVESAGVRYEWLHRPLGDANYGSVWALSFSLGTPV